MIMKISRPSVLFLSLLGASVASGQEFVNFIRQIQVGSVNGVSVEWDVPVAAVSGPSGMQSPLSVDPGGARFELWTVTTTLSDSYLLDQTLVGEYIPQAIIEIGSEDPYSSPPRTRADRPFWVRVNVDELSSDPGMPEASRMVVLKRLVQSYGAEGVGLDLDRSAATELWSETITEEGDILLEYALSSVPGSDLLARRGEETFTVNTLPDVRTGEALTEGAAPLVYNIPASSLASRTIQIWPVSRSMIGGIQEGQVVRFSTPTLRVDLIDLYPSSQTWVQVRRGGLDSEEQAFIVPGSTIPLQDSVPHSRVVYLDNWDEAMDESGLWTIEVMSDTPFGVERLAHVSFTLDRNLEVNGGVTTVQE